MAKLDDFARNSPFSKSVFIEAQQQLLGFGMEAGKVVPTLDAIQQGVAAMGGSNEQISEVVNILANVQSTGKITAETFNQLGYRGLDAAQLIGDSMGKTAAQVREDVSDAALDGRKAIDLLVDGMQNRFGGAADGVKEQWSGAVDRIKAAQRDLGAHIAEPFVSAQGGGMAVTWGNQVADVLRAIEKQAVPVMSILTARGMPFFAGLTQGLDSAAQSIKRWDASTLEVSLDKLANHAPGIAATAGAILALGANVGPLGQFFSVLGVTINPVVAAFAGLAATSPELRSALGNLLAAGQPLLPVLGELAVILSGTLNAALPLVSGGVELLAAALQPIIGLVLHGPLSAVSLALLQFGQRAQIQAHLGGTTTAVGALSTVHGSIRNRPRPRGCTEDSLEPDRDRSDRCLRGDRSLGHGKRFRAAEGAGAPGGSRGAQEHAESDHGRGDRRDPPADRIEPRAGRGRRGNEGTPGHLAQEAAQAVSDGGIAYDSLTQRIRTATDYMMLSTEQEERNRDSKQISIVQQQALLSALEDERSRQAEAVQAKQASIQAEREMAAAMSDSERSSQRFNEALSVARDITQDAETRVRALKQALDEPQRRSADRGGSCEATSATNLDSRRGAGEDERRWGQTLAVDASTVQAPSTRVREGLAFADAMGASRDAMLDAAMAASDQALANGDLTGAVQIDGLIGRYLDVPDMVATVLTADGLGEAETKVMSLLAQLSEIPEGETLAVTVEGNEEAIAKLEELGYKIEESEDGKTVTITSVGADEAIAAMEQINGTWIPDKMFEVSADNTDALSKIEGVEVIQIDGKTAVVYGNNADAQRKIQDVINQGIPGKTSIISADDAQFWARWAVIQAQQNITKYVDIVTRAVDATAGKGSGDGQHVQWRGRSGVRDRRHAVRFTRPHPGRPRSTSSQSASFRGGVPRKPGYRQRNINIAMESLRRLAFPVIPASQVRGIPAFANGGMPGREAPASAPSTAPPVRVERRRRRGRNAPLA
ncbi:hypothetical protein EVAR_101615_1, partial [Eumeta japonica]